MEKISLAKLSATPAPTSQWSMMVSTMIPIVSGLICTSIDFFSATG